MMVNLPLIEQSVFSAIGKDAIYPVPNKWGLQGCTLFDLSKVSAEILADALKVAYDVVIEKTTRKRKRMESKKLCHFEPACALGRSG